MICRCSACGHRYMDYSAIAKPCPACGTVDSCDPIIQLLEEGDNMSSKDRPVQIFRTANGYAVVPEIEEERPSNVVVDIGALYASILVFQDFTKLSEWLRKHFTDPVELA